MRPVIPYVTAALLFGLGVYGVLRRRNAVLVLMSVELLLNAVNLLLVTAVAAPLSAVLPGASAAPPGADRPLTGQVFALFVIVLAAAEVGVGLAIVLRLHRLRGSIAADEVRLDEPHDPQGSSDAEAAAGLAAELATDPTSGRPAEAAAPTQRGAR